MGWSSATEIVEQIIVSAKKYIPKDSDRKQFYKEILVKFFEHDWDTQDECVGVDPMFDEIVQVEDDL